MGFSLSKLLGTKTTETSTTSSDSIKAIIKEVENTPYAVSEQNVLYAGLNELGGYYFFQTVIVGRLKVKSKSGATLQFIGENFELELNADMEEFESEFSGTTDRYVTKIDFEIEESDIKALEKAKLDSILINVKKKSIFFTKHVALEEDN